MQIGYLINKGLKNAYKMPYLFGQSYSGRGITIYIGGRT